MPIADDVDAMMDPILRLFDAMLVTSVEGHAVTAYLRGSSEVVAWAKGALPGAGLPFEGPPISQAVDYAAKRGATMVTQMGEETKRRLAQTISDGIKNKRGIDGLARDIRNTFDDMAKHRPRLIARTETSEALEEAFLDRSNDLGVTGKESIPVAPVDADCLDNANAGLIPLKDAFPSGHQRPPYHPNCKCALAPGML